ncbi:MAG: DNA internalization-related competence protein ComEC/Rec2 [Sandaracinaceae bacterium]|nr:DNA internalization-related competence protein ComEC/Rec2 [Sandaracinaceae bacterium]
MSKVARGPAALAAIAAGLLAGAWAAALGVRVPHAWMAAVAVLGIGGLLAASTAGADARPGWRGWLLFGALAALLGQGLAPAPGPDLDVPRGVARLSGRVEHASASGARLVVEEGRALEGAPVPAGARVFVRGLDVPPGSRVRVLAQLSPRQPFLNPTPHPPWPSTSLDAVGAARSAAAVIETARLDQRVTHAVRRHLAARLRATLSPEAAALAATVLLGERGALDDGTSGAIRGAGLSHVLAVSGLHVTLIAGGLVALLAVALRRARWITSRLDASRAAKLLGVPIALGYAAVIGDAPSAWRAAITASLAWGLEAAGHRGHPIGVTAGAALIAAALHPEDLPRPGFALSILATAAIVSSPGARTTALWRTGLTVASRTMIATAPIVIWIFGALPLAGVLANVVVVPLATVLLIPALAIHAALACAAPPLAALSAPIAEGLARAFVAASEVFAAIEVGQALPPPSIAQGLVVASLCGTWLVATRARTRLVALALACLALGAGELHLRHTERPRGRVRATFLDVGQGDAILVDLPDGRLMAIDAGGAIGSGVDPGARAIVPLLRARRRDRVDVLVLSHPHPDHYGGLAAVLGAVEVGEIWDSGQAAAESEGGGIAELLANAGVPIRGPPELCDRSHRFGAARVDVVWPCPAFDPGWGPNENSLVLDLRFGARRFLFTGDAEEHAERSLLAHDLGSVDVLKVAHHGSRTSSAEPLLAMLRPRVAVVSAGRNNRFGHPHPEVWDRLVRATGCALRTDRHGGVIVETDGEDLRVTPTRGRCSQ